MNKVELLDCTLRDGGFINDWNFGSGVITNVYSRLNASGVDYIELGFINKDYPFDVNRTIMPHTKYLNAVYDAKIAPNAKLLAMVIMGECTIDDIGEEKDTRIDGLRIVFKKKGIDEAFRFAGECRKKGYKIFFQPASVTDYSEEDMLSLVNKTNEFRPEAFYMVDTYGLLNKKRMFEYADMIDKNLRLDIKMGYHSHNNFQLSYATAMEFIERPKRHDVIVDATLFGMGKGTGNLNTELIIDYVNKSGIGVYDNNQILEAIDSDILPIRQNFTWGYSINGFIAASNDCHPKYVQYLLNKKSLSVASVNEILRKIDKENLTIFNKELIESLFLKHQSVEVDDKEAIGKLSETFKDKPILLLATGASISKQRKKISEFIEKNSPIVIAVNHNPTEYAIDFCFINNAKRFANMSLFVNNDFHSRLIATSNIIESSRKIEYKVNYARLLVEGDLTVISENATLMMFNLLKLCGKNEVFVAGFDGFDRFGSECYADNYITFNENKDIDLQNKLIREALLQFRKEMQIELITESVYER